MIPYRRVKHFQSLSIIILVLFALTVQGCFHSSDSKPSNVAPVFTSGTAVSVVQGTSTAVYTAVATDTDVVTYSLSGGTDQTAFSIDSTTGALSFNAVPDFSAPADSDGDNIYVVDITATDGEASAVQAVTITVLANADPAGYYTNTGDASVDDGASGTIDNLNDLQGLVSPDGDLMMLSVNTGIAYVGTITVTEGNFTGSVTIYEAGVAIEKDVPIINGMITQGSSMTGDLNGTGRAANGSFTLNYAGGMDNEPVVLDQVYYNLDWIPVNNSENFTLSINEEPAPGTNFGNGGIGLGTFNNCDFLGRLEPVSGRHLYTISGDMSRCDDATILQPAGYSGLVSVRGTAPDDRLIVVLTNGTYGIIGEYIRFQ